MGAMGHHRASPRFRPWLHLEITPTVSGRPSLQVSVPGHARPAETPRALDLPTVMGLGATEPQDLSG
jgi:hypothetical protein